MPASLRTLAFLIPLMIATPVFADSVALTDDVTDDSPEPPRPKPPAAMAVAPSGPVVTGPDAHALLTEQCDKEEDFVNCFKTWRPSTPEERDAKKKEAEATASADSKKKDGEAALPPNSGIKEAKADSVVPESGTPATPASALVGPAPKPNPQADQASYDALLKALGDSGIEGGGKVLLGNPPQDGSATLELKPTPKTSSTKTNQKQKAPAKL